MTAPLHAYVGRQAIFDRTGTTVGYELLYRDSMENRATFSDVNAASATTLVNAVLEIGLDHIAGALPVWVNLPAAFLLGELAILTPPERTVIEVLEHVPVTPALIANLKGFRQRGYKIALDDFLLTDRTRPLLDVADIVKLDVLNVPQADIRERFEAVRGQVKTLVAEKVSTHDEHTFLHALGFDLFQGYYLELPKIDRTTRMPHDRTTLIRLLAKLYEPKANFRDLDKLIAAEPGLTVRVLKLAGSVAQSRGEPITSVAHAVARLGTQQVAALILLAIAAGFDDKPIELVRKTLIRAKMCEALARDIRAPADQLFTAGLLSLLDAILDQPIQTILAELPVTQLIHDLVTGKPAGDCSRVVAAARAQDRGDLRSAAAAGFPAQSVFVAWYEAVRWTDELVGGLATRR
ncbi:MAG: HDOD domain-containing protein [Kofleriaceae bacterium]